MARFRVGMRVKYRGQRGKLGVSEYDEVTGKYERYVLLDSGDGILVDVKKLQPLTEGEWFDELLEHDKAEWTDQRIGNILRNLEVDVTAEPKYRGVPRSVYRVKGAGQLELPDLAEIV